MDAPGTLIVFSHLRWNFVFQRPQHLMTRFAHSRRVLFIEEPLPNASVAYWEREVVAPGVTACRLHSPLEEPGFHAKQIEMMRPHLHELLQREDIDNFVAWFYSPLAVGLLEGLSPSGIVYDCMDELSAFLHAPVETTDRESELFALADVVFTGGPSLYRVKKCRHHNVHCFPSSVDTTHFRSGVNSGEPVDMSAITRPRLGYMGVIDERMDLQLLTELADARPQWQFVMVGPIVKIDPATLPQRPNIHYLGGRKYDEIPSYLASWDVCLMPFARNAATKHISPTKVLEYMAAGRPVVSTSIMDVADVYSDVVYLGDDPNSFKQACEKAIHASPEDREKLYAKMRLILATTSWDLTAEKMNSLMEEAFRLRSDRVMGMPSGPTIASRDSASPNGGLTKSRGGLSKSSDRQAPTVVIGAGPTGLSAGFHLGAGSLVVEANDTVGGWCRSLEEKGFIFDFAGHIMFSNDPYVHKLYDLLLGENVHWQDREAWIYSKSVHTRYPFQGSLYGLPADVIKECLLGAIEARFGPLVSPKPPASPTPVASSGDPGATWPINGSKPGVAVVGHDCQGSAARNHAPVTGEVKGLRVAGVPLNSQPSLDDCCADGILESSAPLIEVKSPLPETVASRINVKSGQITVSNEVSSQEVGQSAASFPTERSLTEGLVFPSRRETPTGGTEETPERPASTGQVHANFEVFIDQVWGKGIAKHFATPYNRKLWAVPLSEMETSWLGGRVPMPDLGEMIEGALKPSPKPMGPNARFGYPLRGGFQALMNGFLPHMRGALRLNTRVVQVSPDDRTVTFDDGTLQPYDFLISTMPLPLLVRCLGQKAPPEIHEAANRLRYVSVRCVHLGVGVERPTEKHWIYYPEDTVFHRIFVQGNASPHCNPPGGFGLTCEITYSSYKPLPCEGEELIKRCVDDCIQVGIIPADAPIWAAVECDMPHAYVVYDHARPHLVGKIRHWLEERDIILAGRYSEWEYYNSDHAFLAGRKAAEAVRRRRSERLARVVSKGWNVSANQATT